MTKITLDIKGLCELLGISSSTAYILVNKNEIPHFRVRNKILFNRQVIEEWTREEASKQSEKEVRA